MKKPISTLILIVILFNFSSCDHDDPRCTDGHDRIQLVNNSNKTINWKPFDPDSVYLINGSPGDAYIYSNSSFDHGTRNDCWEIIFHDDNTLYMLFFDQDTVAAIGWDNISGTDRGLLKRFKVTLDYLQQHIYTLVYP